MTGNKGGAAIAWALAVAFVILVMMTVFPPLLITAKELIGSFA